MTKDRLGNVHAWGLPYAHGEIIRDSRDDHRKLREAWRHIAAREKSHGLDAVYNLSGLNRYYEAPADSYSLMDDELAPALMGGRLEELALDHLGGNPATDAVMVFNRQTAAILTATLALVDPGQTVIGVSATGSHPCIIRAAKRAGAEFIDTSGLFEFERALDAADEVALVSLTRLAVSYEILSTGEIEKIVGLAHDKGAQVLIDDAAGARVGPAIFDQPKMLGLGVDVGSTGLDKYGTIGPRVGLMAGRRDLVEKMRALAFELGVEARPMIFPAIVHSLEQYDPAQVRDLVDTTKDVIVEVKKRLGNRVTETPVIARLEGEDTLEIALERAGLKNRAGVVPIEASAALSMLLLRDYGVMTVHFAGLPPGTSALLIKFIVPETLHRFGGAEKLADAIDASLGALSDIIGDENALRALLYGEAA